QVVLTRGRAGSPPPPGEPIFTGFMRTAPGPRFWGWGYSLLHLAQVGWPGWALAAGSSLAALCLGRTPRAEDHTIVLALGTLVLVASVAIILPGDPVGRPHGAVRGGGGRSGSSCPRGGWGGGGRGAPGGGGPPGASGARWGPPRPPPPSPTGSSSPPSPRTPGRAGRSTPR